MHQIAAKAIAFGEALKPSFKTYARQIVKNAKAMEKVFHTHRIRLIAGGTDNHLLLADVWKGLDVGGKDAEDALNDVGITLNKNAVADDPRKPFDPSGIRFGTPAITTRGFKEKDCARVAELMIETMRNRSDVKKKKQIREEIRKMSKKHPVPERFV